MARRPEYQWYISRGAAKRISLDSREGWYEWINTLNMKQELQDELDQVLMGDEQRREAFVIEDEAGDEASRHELGWAIFTPEVQIYALYQEDVHAEHEITWAACAWLIARGASALNLWSQSGQEASPLGLRSSDLRLWLNQELNQPLARDPLRLVTLAPSNFELIEALGQLDKVIACEESSTIPDEYLNQIIGLGPDLNPDIDRLSTLKPDLILSSLSVPGMERVVTDLARRGLKQFVLAPRELEDVLQEVLQVAQLLGCESQGREVVMRMEAQRDALHAMRSESRVRVYLEWWPKPMYTPGRACFSNELIELAGGENIFKHRRGSSVEISAEELIDADPEIIFLSWCGVPLNKLNPDQLRKRAGLEGLADRVKTHVYPIDEAFMGRPGPKMLEGSLRMLEKIKQLKDQ